MNWFRCKKEPEKSKEDERKQLELEELKLRVESARESLKSTKASAAMEALKLQELRSTDEARGVFTIDGPIGGKDGVKALDWISKTASAIKTWAHKTIRVKINSPGGDVIEGLAIHDYLVGLQVTGVEVNTVVGGQALSMGLIVAQGGSTRAIAENARVLIHRMTAWEWGNPDQIQAGAEQCRALEELLLKILAKRMPGHSAESLREKSTSDWWLSAEKACALGLFDRVEGQRAKPQVQPLWPFSDPS